MKKRRLLYIGVAVVTFIAGVSLARYALLPSRSFTLVYIDGGAGTSCLGGNRKGISYSVSSWMSSDQQSVGEITIGYQSATDAEHDFQLEQQQADQVVNLTNSRLVGKFGLSYKVIVLDGDHVHYITSPKLEVALDYERSWSEFLSITPHPHSR
ncbi:MAG TPA: hypothetical protein VN843_04675 [Anaerolineales bacterium]|nr:hypothetical protein [Anaerolineales bacterium]